MARRGGGDRGFSEPEQRHPAAFSPGERRESGLRRSRSAYIASSSRESRSHAFAASIRSDLRLLLAILSIVRGHLFGNFALIA